MQRGSSVNFQPVHSAAHAVSHADRTIAPTYLLPADRSLGTIVVLDDRGGVAKALEEKMALASRQAKAVKGYSPLWEGVINLRRPEPFEDVDTYKRECKDKIQSWIEKYEFETGHKVLRADIHLDEGYVEDNITLLNAHAHVICDKTNAQGRVIKMTPQKLRELQTDTATITQLERGVNSRVSGKKHISAHQYKYLAEQGRLENQKIKEQLKDEREANKMLADEVAKLEQKIKKEIEGNQSFAKKILAEKREAKAEVSDLKAQIAQLKNEYADERSALKASGAATQQQYKDLKIKHEAAFAALTKANVRIVKMDEYTKKLEAEVVAERAKVARVLIEKAEAIEALVKSGEKSKAMLKTAQDHRAEADKLAVTMAVTRAPKTPVAPTFSPSLGGSMLQTKKTLTERLKDSWESMMGWIKGQGGKVVQLDTERSSHYGQVVQLDDLHAVQSTGQGKYVIHELDRLDKVPVSQNPKTEIHYRGGVGQVIGNDQDKTLKPKTPGI
jgi:hypothetical protein